MSRERTGTGDTVLVTKPPEYIQGPNLLVDTDKANRKYKARGETNERVKEAVFTCPKGLTPLTFEKGAKEKISTWLAAMERQGWKLASSVNIGPPEPARDLDLGGVVILDKESHRVRAVFEFVGKNETVRIELPPGTVKQAPDHAVRPGGPHSDVSKLVRDNI